MVTVWDARVGLRAAVTAALTLGVVCLVGAATDEGVSWAVRASRTIPLAPAASALGAYLALGSARARGELIALEALGRRPAANALAAAIGGATLSGLGAAAVLLPTVDVRAFFPSITRTSTYVFDGAAFVERAEGIRIAPNGDIVRIAEVVGASSEGLPNGARLAAALATLLVGAALALVGARARPGTLLRSTTAIVLAAAAVLITFQAAGAHVLSVWAAPAVAAALLAAVGARYAATPRA